MFYFNHSRQSVKHLHIKVLWQDIFSDHPGMQLEDQPPHLDHWIGVDQFLCLGE
jgi:hypothetical protein